MFKLGDDHMISDKLKISEAFNEHFVSLGERLAEEIPDLHLRQEITCQRPRKTVQNSFLERYNPIKLSSC